MPRKPVSQKQIAANRANAARSTGPRTPEGKARSAQNACKHGFTASSFAVIRLEELDEVARLKDDLVAVYQPANSQELFAVERIAIAQQALLRAARLESGLFTYCIDEALDRTTGDLFTPMSEQLAGDGDIEITRAQNRNMAVATGFHKMAMRAKTWTLFLRYQAQTERLYRRAVEDFERLRSLCQNEPIPAGIPNARHPAPGTQDPAPGGSPDAPENEPIPAGIPTARHPAPGSQYPATAPPLPGASSQPEAGVHVHAPRVRSVVRPDGVRDGVCRL